MIMNQKKKGMFFGGVSAASYGMTPLFAVPLYADGFSVDAVLFYRYTFASLILCGMMLLQGECLRLSRKEILPLLIMGGLYCVSSLFLFEGYKVMSAGVTATIFFAYPAMVALLMGIFFKERISKFVWSCIFVTMGGIAMLSGVSNGQDIAARGVVVVLLSALAYVLYMIGINKTILKHMSAAKLSFYVLAMGAFVFFMRLHMVSESFPIPLSFTMWTNVVLLAVVPTVISLLTLTRSINYIGSTMTAVLGAFEPITALLLGVIFFGECLTLTNMLGVVLVITSVTFIACESTLSRYWHMRWSIKRFMR